MRRGEGEVTQWPRGLVAYVPKGPADAAPSLEEDRTLHRLELAARLVAVLRSRGEPMDPELALLSGAEEAWRAGDREGARRTVEGLLADLDARTRPPVRPGPTP